MKKIKQQTEGRTKRPMKREIRWLLTICGGSLVMLLMCAPKMISHAETSEQIRSKGVIHYVDESGEEVIFDAGDLEMLFQSAAKGKNGMIESLGGVGTKFFQTEEGWQYSRNPQTETETVKLHSVNDLAGMPFATLTEALSDSQKLPQEYVDSYSLATSDNLTLGNTAWADGSLLLGNNHDLMESYARGWMEGAGYTNMLPIRDENGNVTGYLFE
ncbi:MAG: hypothetical protein IJO97_02120 [Lachnospiraceae bacterium]|nr:hypothetical protein [Lachnospiraceae bacterium]